MALEWLLPILVNIGLKYGIESVQKWQQGRYHDLSEGKPSSKVVISVQTRFDRMRWLPDVVVLALEHDSGWHVPLHAEPNATVRVRLPRGVYRISALHLNVPRDPDAQLGLLGLARERHSIVGDNIKQLTLKAAPPNHTAVKRAGLLLKDGSAPFKLVPAAAIGRSVLPSRPARTVREIAAQPRLLGPTQFAALSDWPGPVVGTARRSVADKTTKAPPQRTRVRSKGVPTSNRPPRDRFIDEITERGFFLGPGAKYIYYHQNDPYPSTRRLVVRSTVVRFEKTVSFEWTLWKSFSLLGKMDEALAILDTPKKGFAKARWAQT